MRAFASGCRMASVTPTDAWRMLPPPLKQQPDSLQTGLRRAVYVHAAAHIPSCSGALKVPREW